MFPWSQMEMAIQRPLLMSKWRVAQRGFVRVPLVSCHYRKSRFVKRVDGILYKSPEFFLVVGLPTTVIFHLLKPQAESSGFQRLGTHEVGQPSRTFAFLSPSLCRTHKCTRPL